MDLRDTAARKPHERPVLVGRSHLPGGRSQALKSGALCRARCLITLTLVSLSAALDRTVAWSPSSFLRVVAKKRPATTLEQQAVSDNAAA